jgi:hypothetical protein
LCQRLRRHEEGLQPIVTSGPRGPVPRQNQERMSNQSHTNDAA